MNLKLVLLYDLKPRHPLEASLVHSKNVLSSNSGNWGQHLREREREREGRRGDQGELGIKRPNKKFMLYLLEVGRIKMIK